MAPIAHVERYRMFELNLTGTSAGNPYADVTIQAMFTSQSTGETVTVNGFYRGQGRYSIRFMPTEEGVWTYETRSDAPSMEERKGEIVVEPAGEGNHGRVLRACDVAKGALREAYGAQLPYCFSYEDGTPYQPYGTTCYAWTNQPSDVQDRTVATLAKAPFNKIRMCVFPKYYDFNTTDPEMFAYEGSMAEGFDHTRFNEPFFENLDRRIEQLDELGIEADIILLHPYDKPEWVFSAMGAEADGFYLSYMARRYAAYKNVWWSLANEYDILLPQKPLEDWRRYARIVMANDPFNHLRSVHNCTRMYDYNETWCTHCSIQRIDVTRTTECIADWRREFGKPVVCDEPGYEGNIYWGWGNLTGEELIRRFWEGVMRRGYVTHGETFIDQGEQVWWAHGGELHGDAPARIAFMRDVFADLPLDAAPLDADMPSEFAWSTLLPSGERVPHTPQGEKAGPYWDVPVLRSSDDYQLVYFGWYRPAYREFSLPEGNRYAVDVIDTWGMTIETLPGTYEGSVRVDLGRQYMAVRIRKA
ncbi:alpha-L-rhamnosidase [Bifidobacterium lemurum]|uniref:Alpha-L-rhamnosidase n=1 Tax=Bifidobacterium lemurum TaxID=1603886 RepID=A0A261FUA6_9BIFI|nr:DUF5605 domain-containing protein [Bifidobacterium lemurum]OZG62770.1 alpha-L-rhamnosidase [Bifidobacterium lemurum]QOL34521.1 DUF5605 domain-containing protein [Bifidobacterium lemurum]